MRYVVVTGASSGIGHAVATDLVQQGYHVFAGVRRQDDAERLQSTLGKRLTPLFLDVTDPAAVQAAVSQVRQTIGQTGLTGLVNNAGIAVYGPLLELPLAELRRQFEVNVFGLVQVTQAFAPLLGVGADRPTPRGRIINISSVSGRIAYPFLGPYAASKHALEALSDSLRRELMRYGVDVIVIQPGSVQTPIWDKAAADALDHLAGSDYYAELIRLQRIAVSLGRRSTAAEKVAQTVRRALEAPHPRTRYTLPGNWLTGWILPRILPPRWLDRLIALYLAQLRS